MGTEHDEARARKVLDRAVAALVRDPVEAQALATIGLGNALLALLETIREEAAIADLERIVRPPR